MTAAQIIPPKVFTLLHLVEFGTRMAGDQADSDALAKLEPMLETAARGLMMAYPAFADVIALIESHMSKGVPAATAVDAARDHIQAAPAFDRQSTET